MVVVAEEELQPETFFNGVLALIADCTGTNNLAGDAGEDNFGAIGLRGLFTILDEDLAADEGDDVDFVGVSSLETICWVIARVVLLMRTLVVLSSSSRGSKG